MHPIFLELGSLTIRWYGVMVAIGFLLATLVLNLNKKYAKMNSDQVTTLVFLSVVFGIIGARVFYVIEFWPSFKGKFWEIFRVDHGGLVFYGGFFLAMVAIIGYCWKEKLNMLRVMDICSPALAVGHAFGRIGCFLNGCCYGKPTQSFLGVIYPENAPAYLKYAGLPVHPVQLYETAANLILASILFVLIRKTKRGVVMSLYIMSYGIIRFVDEFFRGDHDSLTWGLFTPAQVIGLFLIPIGIILLIYFLRKNEAKNNKPDNR
ncbi:prolipoprotein diacylglyceryl transferase [Lentisphaerota bacterium ZTH]|nr:prolipoprotein diacylglyceryl transferase [Lentisphaerota bacterium]WET05260.1 prolipoprotein diacylglyceryl transferase [Lentisphaerota bacterium ZTH]